MKSLRRLWPLAACLAITTVSFSQPMKETAAEKSKRMQWFRDSRFGMFIHWGLYAIPAGEWNGNKGHGEWILETAQIPLEQYTPFQKQFNPTKFDAEKWVLMAKRAGMKYIVITSKHHEGFALFDSAHTDWDIMGTPFKRDIMAELADACRKHGMKICWYHSIMDWHHPDYLPRRAWEKRPAAGADFDRFVKYLRAQVTELLTKYGDIGIMWFDGEWESTWNHKDGQALYDLCRKLQPNVIVNNRVDIGRAGMGGFTEDDSLAGDYGTPEQEIPETGIPGMDWETCMTMNNTWGYSASDKNWKSATTMIQMLCDIASKGGNYLLNVGPTAAGEFPPESIERLDQIGKWMDVNSEAIYETQASPIPAPKWGRVTIKRSGANTTAYLHVFNWPTDGKLVLRGLANDPISATILGSSSVVKVTGTPDMIVLTVPTNAPIAGPNPTVVKLTLRGEPIPLVEPKIVTESEIFLDEATVTLLAPSNRITIRYTTDGTAPTEASTRYEKPFTVNRSGRVLVRGFYENHPIGEVVELTLTKVVAKRAVEVKSPIAGLLARDYEGRWSKLPDFATLKPTMEDRTTTVGLGPLSRSEFVGRVLTGYLVVPADGAYNLELGSDDGSRLFIGDQLTVDHDGLHGFTVKTGQVALAKGYHPIRIEWFNQTGGAGLRLRWGRVGQPLAEVDGKNLVHTQ